MEVGEEVLRRPCREVTGFGLTVHVAGGAGLAANQIEVDLRVFAWDCCLDDAGIRHVGHIVDPVLELPGPGARRDRKDALRQTADRREEVFARRAVKAAGLERPVT
ncbi:hypothetical protein [Kitasatospora herbaricolor]|uniref:Uncharacterized protein n=1 Tax=Kitasatospora herbaricolor TaxID=68217 RepID=A0ABZ1WA98_9ACTN|nr:hypothetical protein [Kitasatospora herbaricolor]